MIDNQKQTKQNIGFIIQTADKDAPIYEEVKDKVSFLTRTIEPKVTKKVYTALHYGTNDDLVNENIREKVASGDVLSPATDYKLYLFVDTKLNTTLSFKTLDDITNKADWGEAPTEQSGLIFLKSLPSDRVLHVKKGELVLFPFLMLNNGLAMYKKDSVNSLFTVVIIDNDIKLFNPPPADYDFYFLKKYFDDFNAHRSFIWGIQSAKEEDFTNWWAFINNTDIKSKEFTITDNQLVLFSFKS